MHELALEKGIIWPGHEHGVGRLGHVAEALF
jgi:hypothetical protein